ncbi:MAG TPA: hypothetical protein VKA38_14885, partial [Draconibacterium sp.]|nr:hypothetical protein [Draconibacterium sp.]
KGELEKLSVTNGNKAFVYFPENSNCRLKTDAKNVSWFNTQTGEITSNVNISSDKFSLPEGWDDGILILN